jgi:Flp pilus assembly protein TadG
MVPRYDPACFRYRDRIWVDMAKAGFAVRLTALLRRFRSNSGGNVAVIFAMALIPILTAIGAATDYSIANRIKAKMQSAADAAAVASISKNSVGYLAAAAMNGNGSVGPGLTDANNIFCGNLNVPDAPSGSSIGCNASPSSGFSNLSLTGSTVTKTGIVLNSVVTFSAKVPTVFTKVIGLQTLTVTGTSKATSSLPPYLDFYLMLDVSGSMGLPSTSGPNSEETRLAGVNPDDYTVYPNGCTFACHFQASGSCTDPSKGQKVNPTGVTSPVNQAYPTNNYCLGYLISRVGPTAWNNLLNSSVTAQSKTQYPMKNGQVLPAAMLSAGLNASLTGPNPLIAGNSKSLSNSLTPVTSCPTAGADNCIQLRADAVGVALNATQAANGVDGLFATAVKSEIVTNQFRIGLYPFVQNLITYFALTSSINNSPTSSGTINYAAANLATLLDTGNSPNVGLGSGGTHFENAFPSMNNIIKTVGDGSSPTNTQPFVFLVTDGAQNFQTCCGFSGNNGATVMPTGAASLCAPLKNRGIIISVLYIPYQTIQDPTTIFNNEDNVANANIPNIPGSLKDCASQNFFFQANTPDDITTALTAMFNQALQVAHITN